jgi:MFS family permease
MAPLFFPTSDLVVALLLAYSAFATGIVFRPLGLWLAHRASNNGWLQHGFKGSLTGLGLAMIGMGIVPSHAHIGVSAAFLLFLLRALLDVAAAFERTFARFFVIDNLSSSAATHWLSVYNALGVAGLGLASLAGATVAHTPSLWRFFFIAGGLLSLSLLVGRTFLPTEPQKTPPQSAALWRLIAQNVRPLLRLSAVHSFSYATYALPFLLLPLYVPLICGPSSGSFYGHTPWLFVLDITATLLLGRLFCHVSPARTLRYIALGGSLSWVPLFALLPCAGTWFILAVRLWIIGLGVLFDVMLPLWEKEAMQQTHAAGTAGWALCSIGKTLGSSLVGRNIVALSLASYHLTGQVTAPAWLCLALGGITYISLGQSRRS